MRHMEVLIIAVALLSKRPHSLDVFLPAPERMSISKTHAGALDVHPFRSPARKGVKA